MGTTNSSPSANMNDLNLSRVETDEYDQAAIKIENYYKGDGTVKQQLSWGWERNHLMLDGKQWIVYDGERETGGIWKRLRVSKQNEYIPRPTTNYLYDIYQTLKAYLLKNRPRSQVFPNTQTYRDKNAAKIATLILDANWERLREQYNYEYAASCALTYGTVFKKSYWDTSSLSIARIPRMEMRPKMDPATGAVIGQEEVQALDEEGRPAYDELPLGDVSTAVIEPYRIAIDPLATDLHTLRWIMEYSIQPIDLVKENFSKELPGYTGKAEELEPETDLSGPMRRFYQLKNSSGVKSMWGSASESMSASDSMIDDAVVLKEYYERPCQKYPKGRLFVVANGKTLYAGDSPYSGPEQSDWHPYSDFRWEIVPGRFWGKSPLDDSVEIQKQINSIDSVIILTRKTMAIPQKLIPTDAGVEPGSWTGRPGAEVKYRNTGGPGPSIVPASGVDQQVFQERAQRLEDMKQISGAVDILKGDRPPGVTAASALNMLYEVGTGKLYPSLERWKYFIESDQKKQLRIVSKMYKEPRPAFIKMLKAKNSELSEQSLDNFIGEDLYDNCNVIIEAGSYIPKLQAAKQQGLSEAAQIGTLSLELPANRLEFNRQMGISGFDNDVGPDTKRAEWENDLLDNIQNSPDNKPIVLDIDDHMIHEEVHKRRMKEPTFMSLPFEVQQAYMLHLAEHQQKQAEAQQQQMIQAMAAGGPPPQQQDANAPREVQGQGKGATAPIKNSLAQDVMIPGALGKRGG